MVSGHHGRTGLVFVFFMILAMEPFGSTSSVRAQNARDKLDRISDDLGHHQAREEELVQDVEALKAEMNILRLQLVEAARNVQEREGDLDNTGKRLTELQDAERLLLAQLDTRKKEWIDTLTALQRLDRNPPPALVVKPADAVNALRSAFLLGSVAGVLEKKALHIRKQLEALRQLRADIVRERRAFDETTRTLESERETLEKLLRTKMAAQSVLNTALQDERQEVARLAREARTLSDLIRKLETRPVLPRRPRRSGDDAGHIVLSPGTGVQAGTAGRLFSGARGELRVPVQGQLVRTYGELTSLGSKSRGVTLKTRPGAQITAPFDGNIVYAGPFRQYGHLLILSVGEGYHLLMAGMTRIDGSVGQDVLAGEPVGIMGGLPSRHAEKTRAGEKPVLYVEFRKNGSTINPWPWFDMSERKAQEE